MRLVAWLQACEDSEERESTDDDEGKCEGQVLQGPRVVNADIWWPPVAEEREGEERERGHGTMKIF